MPNLILEPLAERQGSVTDPAADMAAFLLASKDWKPTDVPGRELNRRRSAKRCSIWPSII